MQEFCRQDPFNENRFRNKTFSIRLYVTPWHPEHGADSRLVGLNFVSLGNPDSILMYAWSYLKFSRRFHPFSAGIVKVKGDTPILVEGKSFLQNLGSNIRWTSECKLLRSSWWLDAISFVNVITEFSKMQKKISIAEINYVVVTTNNNTAQHCNQFSTRKCTKSFLRRGSAPDPLRELMTLSHPVL